MVGQRPEVSSPDLGQTEEVEADRGLRRGADILAPVRHVEFRTNAQRHCVKNNRQDQRRNRYRPDARHPFHAIAPQPETGAGRIQHADGETAQDKKAGDRRACAANVGNRVLEEVRPVADSHKQGETNAVQVQQNG